MNAIRFLLIGALGVGCAIDESAQTAEPECGPGQEVIELDGETVCADEVHDLWSDSRYAQHSFYNATYYSWSAPLIYCQGDANYHCQNTHAPSGGYKHGTLSSGGGVCKFYCQ
jgi:hypothetical protein